MGLEVEGMGVSESESERVMTALGLGALEVEAGKCLEVVVGLEGGGVVSEFSESVVGANGGWYGRSGGASGVDQLLTRLWEGIVPVLPCLSSYLLRQLKPRELHRQRPTLALHSSSSIQGRTSSRRVDSVT